MILVPLILSVFFCVVARFTASLAGLPYEDVAIGALAFIVFQLATAMAKKGVE